MVNNVTVRSTAITVVDVGQRGYRHVQIAQLL